MIERWNSGRTEMVDRSDLSGLFSDEDAVSYQRTLIDEITLNKQPFDYDPLSPTPLDPFHLHTQGPNYYHAAEIRMEDQLDAVAEHYQLPDEIKDVIQREVVVEHEHRSHKNNATMRKLRSSFPEGQPIEREMANDIIAARAAVSTIGRLALVLVRSPEIGGIEVMKYTRFLDNRAMMIAHASFISRIRKAEMESDGKFIVAEKKIEMAETQILDTSENVGPHIIAFKGKEADLEVNGVPLELIGRYSFIALDKSLHVEGVQPSNVPAGERTANVQSIAITKYLRIAK